MGTRENRILLTFFLLMGAIALASPMREYLMPQGKLH